MLLPNNSQPENSLYYNGALVLQELASSEGRNLSLADLYAAMHSKHNLSASLLMLSLDWLFLLNAATINSEGVVSSCS